MTNFTTILAFLPLTVFAVVMWGMALYNILALLEIQPRRAARAKRAYKAWKTGNALVDQAYVCMTYHHDTRCIHCTPAEDTADSVILW